MKPIILEQINTKTEHVGGDQSNIWLFMKIW
jgi:hypothetical protein